MPTMRHWWNRFGPMFAADTDRQRVSRMCGFRHWKWHRDEMYVRGNGEVFHLWRGADQEDEVLETHLIKTRRSAALAEWQILAA